MGTTRKTIRLTDQQEQWIKAQIERGGFTNDREYIRDLIRRDQESDKLRTLKGCDSGRLGERGKRPHGAANHGGRRSATAGRWPVIVFPQKLPLILKASTKYDSDIWIGAGEGLSHWLT
ncbi:MAG: hypothetical protein ABIP64_05415 [Burkholderiales bacterium]